MVGRGVDSTDFEILQVFAESADPVLGTSEVASELDYSDTGIRERLYELSKSGYLSHKKIGNSPAFWITNEGIDHLGQLED